MLNKTAFSVYKGGKGCRLAGIRPGTAEPTSSASIGFGVRLHTVAHVHVHACAYGRARMRACARECSRAWTCQYTCLRACVYTSTHIRLKLCLHTGAATAAGAAAAAAGDAFECIKQHDRSDGRGGAGGQLAPVRPPQSASVWGTLYPGGQRDRKTRTFLREWMSQPARLRGESLRLSRQLAAVRPRQSASVWDTLNPSGQCDRKTRNFLHECISRPAAHPHAYSAFASPAGKARATRMGHDENGPQ